MSDDEPTLRERIAEWCVGKDWRWRAAVLVFVSWQAVHVLRESEGPTLFGAITFGAHEFGHLFFSFGGEWLTIAGGSLMQLLVPIGAGAALVKTSGDWFGATVCGTWLAASLADLAIYVGDARAQELDLLSFSADGAGHDWHYLLAHAGLLKSDLLLARGVRFAAVVVLVASVLFAAGLFRRMARRVPTR